MIIYCQDIPALQECFVSTLFYVYFVGLDKKIVENIKGMFCLVFPSLFEICHELFVL